MKEKRILIGVDTGGTFTDFIYKEGEHWGVYKRLSTPSNPAEAVLEGISRIAGRFAGGIQVVHGSTVATNALLERKGVKTALVTNAGFEDVLEIGRQNRSELYNLTYAKEPPIVPAELRMGVKGRIVSSGLELEPLDEEGARAVAASLAQRGVESAAVCFLFSYLNPEHEKAMGRILDEWRIPASLSHEILSELREYERTVTTAINAYVSPRMKRYIHEIARETGASNLRIMQSNGGSISAETAMAESVRTILSGPAGGAVGAFETGRRAGFRKIIGFDMGGTSTDVCLMDDKLPLALESRIAGFPVKVPMIDIHTVGAGGGSIARMDMGGALKVGPRSAGADPGPVCYGKGEEITVTDANLYLGRLAPDHFLGGEMTLEARSLEPLLRKMAEHAGLAPAELAEGILAVANAAMERAVRVISVERGFDPREFTLLSFGGAGGMHAAFLARLLNMPRVLVPRNPGILSAIGMLMADIIKDYSLTVMLDQESATPGKLQRFFHSLEAKALDEMEVEGIPRQDVILEPYLDMRYRGQSYEIVVPRDGDFVESFHARHETRYGYRNPDKIVEVVNVRLRARGASQKPESVPEEAGPQEVSSEAFLGRRPVVFDHEAREAPLYSRDGLMPGNRFDGPAIVVEYSSTIVVPPFARGSVDGYGNVILEME